MDKTVPEVALHMGGRMEILTHSTLEQLQGKQNKRVNEIGHEMEMNE